MSKQVSYSNFSTVFMIKQTQFDIDARDGAVWLISALDRERFKQRILNSEILLNPILKRHYVTYLANEVVGQTQPCSPPEVDTKIPYIVTRKYPTQSL